MCSKIMWLGFYIYESGEQYYEKIKWLSAYYWVWKEKQGSGICLRLTPEEISK